MLRAGLAAFMVVAGVAPAQRCPPNSHAQAVGIPGNLRTAQCFCNAGYESVRGACVLIRSPNPKPRAPSDTFVPPQTFR